MQQPTLDNYIKILIAHLVNEGMSPEDAIKAMDHLLGELCVKYEQLRGNSSDEVLDRVYRGGPFNRSDVYFLEKRKKFFNAGYPFANELDGGNRPRLGKVLREYIERMDNRV